MQGRRRRCELRAGCALSAALRWPAAPVELAAARGMTERLNARRRRVREAWVRRQALNAGPQTEA